MKRRIIPIFLAFSLILTTATACTFGGLPKPKPTKKTIAVDPLYYKDSAEGPTGGYSKCKITVEPNPSKKLRVGFFEEEVGGAGPQWRAAGWMAAIIGSFLIGHDVSDYKFSIDVGGYIDGPSAGALMTSAVLACLMGDEIKKDVTMTGTINPDGTIGPIGGIPQKLDGAKKAKKKKVLIPAGQRYDYDMKTEQSVDVVNLGEEKGIEVVEVANIYEAYKELTGKELPKIAGASTKAVDLPSETFDKVRAKAKKWYGRYLEERAKYDQVVFPIALDTSDLDSMVAEADNYAALGDKYLGQGMIASAYDQITTAVLYTSMAYHAKKSIESYLNAALAGGDGVSASATYLDTVNPSGLKIDAALDDLKTRKPATLADTMTLADAYGTLSIAMGLVDLATSQLQSEPATEEEALENIMLATVYYAAASHIVDGAEDRVDIGLGMGKAKPAETAS